MRRKTGNKLIHQGYIPPEDYQTRLEEVKQQDTGLAIRELYCFYRRAFELTRTGQESDYGRSAMPQWDGGLAKGSMGTPDRRMVAVWPKIARFCEENALDPSVLLRIVFMQWKDATAPSPTYFLSGHLVDEYNKSLTKLLVTCDASLRTQKQQFDSELAVLKYAYPEASDLDLARRILCDGTVQLTPLGRFVLARVLKQHDIAGYYASDAELQVSLNKTVFANTDWAKLLPAEWLK